VTRRGVEPSPSIACSAPLVRETGRGLRRGRVRGSRSVASAWWLHNRGRRPPIRTKERSDSGWPDDVLSRGPAPSGSAVNGGGGPPAGDSPGSGDRYSDPGPRADSSPWTPTLRCVSVTALAPIRGRHSPSCTTCAGAGCVLGRRPRLVANTKGASDGEVTERRRRQEGPSGAAEEEAEEEPGEETPGMRLRELLGLGPGRASPHTHQGAVSGTRWLVAAPRRRLDAMARMLRPHRARFVAMPRHHSSAAGRVRASGRRSQCGWARADSEPRASRVRGG
jgi:hypothetical protein